jgi:hypothetical protein
VTKKQKAVPAINEEFQRQGAFVSSSEQQTTTNEKDSLMNDSFSDDSFTFQPDFSETYEEKAMPAGSEVRFEIRSADLGVSQKTGGRYIRMQISLPDEPEAKDFNEFISLPSPNDDKKTANRKNNRMRKFMAAVGLDESQPFAPSDLVGLSGVAILGLKEDPEYGEQNSIKQYVVGR